MISCPSYATFERVGVAGFLISIALISNPGWAAGNGMWQGGSDVYREVCGYCHEAGVGPVIKGRQLPTEYITQVVRGRFLAMPAFPASFIDDKSLQDVAKVVSQSPAPAKK